MQNILLTFGLLMLYSFTTTTLNEKKPLYLEVEGIERVEGNLGVLVFNKHEGFPKSEKEAILSLEVKVTSTKMKIELNDLPLGSYAFSIIQDINSNKKLDVNLFGIPKEPYGFSNNPNTFLGIPTFKDALVSFTEKQISTKIRLASFY